jgi:nitrate reductase gamma subunit
MEFLLLVIGQIMPYVAVVVFLAGLAYRINGWFRAPVRHKLTLFPAPQNAAGQMVSIAGELVLFRSLWKGDKKLWAAAWLLHVSLLAVIGGHLVGIPSLGKQFTLFGLTEAQSVSLSVALGTISGMVLMGTLLYLLFRRFYHPDVRRLSDAADFFDLMLLLTVVITGNHMRFVHIDLPVIQAYLGSLIQLSPTPIPRDPLFIVHVIFVQILLIYFPFSKLVHLVGALVSRAIVSSPVASQRTAVEIGPVQPNTTVGGRSV